MSKQHTSPGPQTQQCPAEAHLRRFASTGEGGDLTLHYDSYSHSQAAERRLGQLWNQLTDSHPDRVGSLATDANRNRTQQHLDQVRDTLVRYNFGSCRITLKSPSGTSTNSFSLPRDGLENIITIVNDIGAHTESAKKDAAGLVSEPEQALVCKAIENPATIDLLLVSPRLSIEAATLLKSTSLHFHQIDHQCKPGLFQYGAFSSTAGGSEGDPFFLANAAAHRLEEDLRGDPLFSEAARAQALREFRGKLYDLAVVDDYGVAITEPRVMRTDVDDSLTTIPSALTRQAIFLFRVPFTAGGLEITLSNDLMAGSPEITPTPPTFQVRNWPLVISCPTTLYSGSPGSEHLLEHDNRTRQAFERYTNAVEQATNVFLRHHHGREYVEVEEFESCVQRLWPAALSYYPKMKAYLDGLTINFEKAMVAPLNLGAWTVMIRELEEIFGWPSRISPDFREAQQNFRDWVQSCFGSDCDGFGIEDLFRAKCHMRGIALAPRIRTNEWDRGALQREIEAAPYLFRGIEPEHFMGLLNVLSEKGEATFNELIANRKIAFDAIDPHFVTILNTWTYEQIVAQIESSDPRLMTLNNFNGKYGDDWETIRVLPSSSSVWWSWVKG